MTEMSTKQDESQLPLQLRYWYLGILALSGFVTSFGAHIVATNLPAYAQAAGVGAFVIGLLIGVYDFAELFAKPVAGFIADRRGMKLTLLVGLGIFIFGSVLFLVISPTLLLLVRFIQGVVAAAGIYNAIKGAGYVIAPALGGYLVHTSGFVMLFVVSAAVGVVALLLSLFLPGDRGEHAELADDDDDISLRQFFVIFTERRLLPVYAVIVINMFLVGILFGFLPVYLYAIGYTPLESGTVVSIATVSYLLVQPLAGNLADRVAVQTTVIIGLLLAALAIIAVTFTTGVPLLITVIVAGIGIGTVWTNSDTMVSKLATQNQLGASIGAAQSFKEFGDMIGPLLIGALTQFFGVRVGFVSCGVLAVLFLIALARSRTLTTLPQR